MTDLTFIGLTHKLRNNVTEWSIATGFVPVNIKSTQSAAFQQFMNEKPVLKVFLEQMPAARGRPIIADYNS